MRGAEIRRDSEDSDDSVVDPTGRRGSIQEFAQVKTRRNTMETPSKINVPSWRPLPRVREGFGNVCPRIGGPPELLAQLRDRERLSCCGGGIPVGWVSRPPRKATARAVKGSAMPRKPTSPNITLTTVWGRIVTTQIFENTALLLILSNAIWIGVDVNYNVKDSESQTRDVPKEFFQIGESISKKRPLVAPFAMPLRLGTCQR
eukprot:6350731-Amphidinium_carterae.1